MAHRKTRRIYDEALTFENLFAAWKTVSKTCQNRRGVFEFGLFAHARVMKILIDLKCRNYHPNRFRCFMIFEPKPRLVMSQSIKDKVVNHFVANHYLMPFLERTLIDANVATRKKKGASEAQRMLRRYFSQMEAKRPGEKIYALKVDVSKYFYTIDHGILFEKLERKIKDKDVIEILRRIIDETNKPYVNKAVDKFNERFKTEIPHYESGKGLSIGAVVSQFLAIYYLGDLDRYIKENLKREYYIRYMDDFLILGWDKRELMKIKDTIEQELMAAKLKINPKSTIYNCCSAAGVPFLGYRYCLLNGKLRIFCLASTVRRIRARLKVLAEYDSEKYKRSYASYQGYFMHTIPRASVVRSIFIS